MLLTRKVELMKRYNFDEMSSGFVDHGFGNMRALLAAYLYPANGKYLHLDDPKQRSAILDGIYLAYGFMRIRYDAIDFDELDREIQTEEDRRDFSTLYKTRDILPKLGNALGRFVIRGNQTGWNIDTSSPECVEALRLVQEVMDADRLGNEKSWRGRLWELEEQLASEKSQEGDVSQGV